MENDALQLRRKSTRVVVLEIGILYSSFAQQWVPFDQVATLPTTGVLTITLTSERGNRLALLARRWSLQNNDQYAGPDSWWGDDNYVIGVTPDGEFFTDQWADKDQLRLRSIADPHGVITLLPRDRGYPANSTLHTFRGAYVSPALWAQALQIFEDEMF